MIGNYDSNYTLMDDILIPELLLKDKEINDSCFTKLKIDFH